MDDRSALVFFDALRGLSSADAAGQRFEQLLAGADMPPPAQFFEGLYRGLVDFALEALAIPASTGGAAWEWRPLYALHREINPGYFTPADLAACLGACPPLAAGPREVLLGVLNGYFVLRREGFPAGYPARLVSAEDTARWCAIFPAAQAWAATDVLRRAGLYPLASAGGWRALTRFAQGRFAPEAGCNGLYRWHAACRAVAETPAGAAPAAAAPSAEYHRLDFLAAVFAGEFAAWGLPGVCTPLPQCVGCPLRARCRWHAAPTEEHYTPAAVLAHLAQQQLASPAPTWPQAAAETPGERSSAGPAEPARLSTAQLLDAALCGAQDGAPIFGAQPDLPALRALAALSPRELQERLGLNATRHAQLAALFELARRYADERLAPGARIRSAQDVYKHFHLRLRDLRQEQFLVLLLDLNRRVLGEVLVTQGLLDKSLVHPREVFSEAVRVRAAAVILVHNHPSGNTDASQQDFEVTRVLIEAGRKLGIKVVDHVIVAERGYTSFAEKQLLLFT